MEQYQRNFLWGTTAMSKQLHLLQWKPVTSPTKFLIQPLRTKNNALLASLAWRLFSPHSLWAKTLLNKYLLISSVVTNHSPIWRNILKGWDHCQLGLQWKIGTGQYIKLWTDSWINAGTPLRSLIQGPLPLNHHQNPKLYIYNPNFLWLGIGRIFHLIFL